jgi:uncharacterized protein
MNKRVARYLLLLCFLATPLAALEVPALKGHVNDYANLLSRETVAALEARLAEFEKAESTQIVILTIPSLQGEVLEEYSIKVAGRWKIGQKKLDNGVILLISKNDRKMRIEVGYGLEGRLTDLLAGRIIDNDIRPFFKEGKYDAGVSSGVNAIVQAVRGEYRGMKPEPAEKPGFLRSEIVIPVCVVGGMFLVVLVMFLIARKSPGSGSGGGYNGDSSGSSSSGSSSDSSSSSSDSGSSCGDSGGGGSFGGGGASGDW